MSDDLRTRIAAALEKDAYRQSEWWDELPNMDELADAVIAELGLQQEWITRHESGGGTIHNTSEDAFHRLNTFVVRPPGVEDPGSGRLTGVESRYVTEWVADDRS